MFRAGVRAKRIERFGQRAQRIEIMNRSVRIDMRQQGPNPRGAWLEPVVAQERIEPDQAATRQGKSLRLGPQQFRIVAFQSVGDQQHNRSLTQHAARPAAIEFVQAGGDARPAGPVIDRSNAFVHGAIGVLGAEHAGHGRQAGSEEEGLRVASSARQGVQKMQENP